MVAASVIPPQERKTFHLSLLEHLNGDLKIELFLLQWKNLNRNARVLGLWLNEKHRWIISQICFPLQVNDLFGSISYLNLLISTTSFLEFYIVETRSLFDVFFRGYIAQVEG